MDILFSRPVEVFLIALMAVFTVLLFSGNGTFLLKSKSNPKKRTPEEEKYLSRHLGIVTLLWMIGEIMLMLFKQYAWVTIVYMIVLVVSMVYLILLFKKFD